MIDWDYERSRCWFPRNEPADVVADETRPHPTPAELELVKLRLACQALAREMRLHADDQKQYGEYIGDPTKTLGWATRLEEL